MADFKIGAINLLKNHGKGVLVFEIFNSIIILMLNSFFYQRVNFHVIKPFKFQTNLSRY